MSINNFPRFGQFPRKGGGPIAYLRRRFGGEPPLVTLGITLICVMVWLVQMAIYFFGSPSQFLLMNRRFAFSPVLASYFPWTFITSMFMHSTNLTHILFNMITLWVVGPVLEGIMGHWPYLLLYLVSGLGGDLGLMVYVTLTQDNWNISAIGASGALFGLFAAILVIYRRMNMDIRSMIIWMVINFCMPLFVPNIAWQEHVGGFLAGGLLMLILVSIFRRFRGKDLTWRWILASAVFILVLVVLFRICTPSHPSISTFI